MDAIEILGSLLGNKSGGSGMGTEILKQILKGGLRSGESSEQPPSGQRPSERQPSGRHPSDGRSSGRRSAPVPDAYDAEPGNIERSARDLEDLLDVARQRNSHRTAGPSQPRQPRSPEPWPQRKTRAGYDSSGSGSLSSRYDKSPVDADRQNEHALILVRAMVNAAKSDGQISQTEQQGILNQLESASSETIQFLREEFSRPLDVREFTWSVPLGMEQQVYALSLVAIDLDSNPEARYLSESAHGLRIPPHICDQIHQRLGAPAIR